MAGGIQEGGAGDAAAIRVTSGAQEGGPKATWGSPGGGAQVAEPPERPGRDGEINSLFTNK